MPPSAGFIINPFVFGGGGGPTDPHFADVRSLLHFDGSDGSTTITDVIAGHTWTCESGAALSTAEKQFGTASGLLTSSSQSFLGASHADFALGTADFTIEFSLYQVSLTNTNIFDMRPVGGNGAFPTIYALTDGSVGYYANTATRIASSTGLVTAGAWHTIAYSRVSGTGRLFVDGTSVGSWTDSLDYTGSGGMNHIYVGAWAASPLAYYDEFRLTAYGRYAANYTPAVAAFPNS